MSDHEDRKSLGQFVNSQDAADQKVLDALEVPGPRERLIRWVAALSDAEIALLESYQTTVEARRKAPALDERGPSPGDILQ